MRILFLAAALFSFFTTIAQPRFTDSTFGNNGKVVENTSASPVDIVDALLQPDGKTLTLAASEYNAINRTVLIRHNTDGTPDASFSGNGVADSLIIPSANCNPLAMRLQPDGKILVCGDTGYYPKKGIVMRYNADGSLDASFGTAGILYLPTFTLNGVSFSLPDVNDLAILSGGKIMLLCTRDYPNNDFVLIRLNSNGTTDNGFGTNGIAAITPQGLPYYNPAYTHIAVQTDGKYIVGGNFNGFGHLLVRANSTGTLDNSYGTNGYSVLSGGAGLMDMILQSDNKVVVSGPESYTYRTYTTVLRVTTAGSLDASFGNGGKQFIYASGTGFTTIKPQLYLQADGKILIGGMAKNSAGNFTIAAARLTTAGALDTGFDGDGVALLQVNGFGSYGFAPLQQADGKIVITGYARSNDIQSVTIGRFTVAGQTDATLNATSAVIQLNSGPNEESGINLHVQPADQKIVSVRERSNAFDYDLCVSRHLPNGQPDTNFGANGKVYLDLPGYYYEVYSGISADGKITVIPDFADYTTYGSLAVFRLKPNGQPDSSFGQNGKRIFKSRSTDTIINFLSHAVVQPDGKTLMAVYQGEGILQPNNQPDSFFIIRLNNDGSFDNSFNGNGKKYIPNGGGSTHISGQPDGKVITANVNYASSGTGYSTYISRLNANGSTDATFNNGVAKELSFEVIKVTLQPDGKILTPSYQSKIARLNSNGSYDSTFGTGGIVDATNYFRFSGGDDHIYDIRIDSNHIVVAGRVYDSITGIHLFKVVAFKTNGSVDSAFGQSGVATSDFFPNGYGEQIGLQADGKVVITGSTENTSNPNLSDFALTRLKSGPLTTGRLYTFIGSGLWSNAANWSNSTMPPTTIPAGSSIIIDPSAGSECVIDITVHVQAGATVTVRAGKQVRLPGNLIIQ